MKKIILIAIPFIIISCTGTQQKAGSAPDLSKIKQMDWALGKWENISPKGSLYEMWAKINDSTYQGKSFMIVNKDTVSAENVSLELRNNELFYIPKVKNQNNGASVSFKLIPTTNQEITFENKEHDFPQRVIYKNAGPDSLYARIEGNYKGKFMNEEYPMKRSAK